MAPQLLDLPLELRNEIYKCFLPSGSSSYWIRGYDGNRRSFAALLAVNKQMRAEVTDVFNAGVILDLTPSCGRMFLDGTLIDLSLFKDGLCLVARVKEDILFRWNVSKAKKFVVRAELLLSSSLGDEGVQLYCLDLKKCIQMLVEKLRAVERIVKLEVRLVLHGDQDKFEFPLTELDMMVREYGDFFRSKLTQAMEAKLTGNWGRYAFSVSERKWTLHKLEKYIKEWEQDMVQYSD
jgi:hypothetical protein